MTRPRRILCYGRTYCDLIFQTGALPEWGHEYFADGFAAFAGGGAFNTGAYLAALGHDVRLAGPAGAEQPFGGIIRRDLDRAGMDGAGLVFDGAAQVTVVVSGPKDRAFLSHSAGPDMPLPDLSDIDHLHIGELATLADCPALPALAREMNATVSCDCGGADIDPAPVADLLQQVDVFLPNQSEWQALGSPELPHLVVKCGGAGAELWLNGQRHSAPAVVSVVTDTTGAGDAFNAGYLHGWLTDAPVAERLALANQCGAAAVTSVGGWPGAAQISAPPIP